jgi:receptor protein-tyrosine kinase
MKTERTRNLTSSGYTREPGYDLTLGAILVETGRLSEDDVERIRDLQEDQGLEFGEAGIALGVLTQDDLQYALARQFNYPYLARESSLLSPELVAAFEPYGRRAEALRALRSHIMLRWFTGEPGHRALAVVSPSRGEGRSVLAANLAIVFCQVGEKTLLIDADMRHSRQHELFQMDPAVGLSSVLSGRATWGDAIRQVPDLMDLWILPAGPTPPNPQELLARGAFGKRIMELREDYDVIILDTPEAEGIADVHVIAAAAGAALVIAKKGSTSVTGISHMAEALRQVGVNILGSVLMTD